MAVIEIPLLNCDLKALIDSEDLDLISTYKWSVTSKSKKWKYALTSVGGIQIKMHRLLMGLPPHEPSVIEWVVDHIDGNGLNNTRSNLRVATVAQNAANRAKRTYRKMTSKYKGVSFNKRTGKWMAHAACFLVGSYATELEAHQAYMKRANELYGEFARPF